MLARSACESASRRRLLGGIAFVGLSVVMAGCDRTLASVPTSFAGSQSKSLPPTKLKDVEPPTSPAVLVGAAFGKVVALEGVTVEKDTVRAGEYLRLWLHWQAIGPASEAYRSIGRLVTDNARVIASEDDQIGGRRHHLTRWQVGERCVDEMRLRIVPSAPSGEYGLLIGVLRLDNQTAVPLTTRPKIGAAWQEDLVLVGTVEVVEA